MKKTASLDWQLVGVVVKLSKMFAAVVNRVQFDYPAHVLVRLYTKTLLIELLQAILLLSGIQLPLFAGIPSA
jgi:hypothetical protein